MAWAGLLFLLWPISQSTASPDYGRPVTALDTNQPVAKLKAPLPGAKDTVQIVRLPDGQLHYLVQQAGSNNDRLLTPEEFTQLFYLRHTGQGWLATIFNVTSPAGLAWVGLGLAGQLIFMGRMLVQWITSEKRGQSVVPVLFWWMSLVGATMLLVYFIWRRDIVGILGQGLGWVIYIRNLMLIRRSREG